MSSKTSSLTESQNFFRLPADSFLVTVSGISPSHELCAGGSEEQGILQPTRFSLKNRSLFPLYHCIETHTVRWSPELKVFHNHTETSVDGHELTGTRLSAVSGSLITESSSSALKSDEYCFFLQESSDKFFFLARSRGFTVLLQLASEAAAFEKKPHFFQGIRFIMRNL